MGKKKKKLTKIAMKMKEKNDKKKNLQHKIIITIAVKEEKKNDEKKVRTTMEEKRRS